MNLELPGRNDESSFFLKSQECQYYCVLNELNNQIRFFWNLCLIGRISTYFRSYVSGFEIFCLNIQFWRHFSMVYSEPHSHDLGCQNLKIETYLNWLFVC